MAPSLLAAAAASPFLVAGSSTSRRPLGAAPTRRAAGLRVAALKYDPAKVGGLGAVTTRSGFDFFLNLQGIEGFWVGF
jgi:chaperonin GroES